MFWIIAIGYVLVGVFKASAHLESGQVGAKGPTATFCAVTLLWPVLLKGQGGAVLFWIIVIAVIYIFGSSEKNSPAAVAENAPVMASKPEMKSSVGALAPPNIATSVKGGAASQGEQIRDRPIQPYANPTAPIVGPPSSTISPESTPEKKYANLVTEMEIKGEYACAECTDPFARCRLNIPRKTLESQSEKEAWIRLLNDANGDPNAALKPLLKEQGC